MNTCPTHNTNYYTQCAECEHERRYPKATNAAKDRADFESFCRPELAYLWQTLSSYTDQNGEYHMGMLERMEAIGLDTVPVLEAIYPTLEENLSFLNDQPYYAGDKISLDLGQSISIGTWIITRDLDGRHIATYTNGDPNTLEEEQG